MNAWSSPALWSYGFAAVAYAVFGLLLLARWRFDLRSLLFVGFALAGALWGAASVVFALDPRTSWWRAAAALDALRTAAALLFVWIVLRGHAAARPFGARGAAGPAALLAAVGALTVLRAPPPGVPEWDGATYLPAFAISLGLAVAGLVLAEQLSRRVPVRARWNVRPLVLGLAGMFAYDLVMYSDAILFRTLGEGLWSARGLVHAMALPLFGLAAARNRQWSFDIALSRGALAGSAALLLSGAYLCLVAVAAYLFRLVGGQWGVFLPIVVVSAAAMLLLALLASGSVRAALRVFVAKHFYRHRFDYREQWLRFTRTLSQGEAGEPLHTRCIGALADLVESHGGTLWLRGPGGDFVQAGRLNQPRVDTCVSSGDGLIGFLARTGWVVEVADVRARPGAYGGQRLPPALEALTDTWLLAPLLTGEGLLGFVTLATPRARIDLDWEVRDLLKTAGRQAAGYLAQAAATEALLEARKFEAFSRMSAFVVHDLKNLAAQLQLMLRNAQRHGENPDFRRDMLGTIEQVAQRLNRLMLQLRSGEVPVSRPHPVDLAAAVQQVQRHRVAVRDAIRVTAEPEVHALAHEDRVERVIGHLVQNALEAAAGEPEVAVRVYRDGAHAVVEVRDRGVGMTREFVEQRLFRPFQTTKEHGMGIGMFESHQYVNGVGGRVEVDTEPGRGTTVRVRFVAAAGGATAFEGAG
jgi:putative PEP-CTERM system histidine kinase